MDDINRSLVVVKPKQPFLDWVHSCDKHRYTLEEVREDSTAYLLPEYDLVTDKPQLLQEFNDYMFESELLSWYTDEAMWPKDRDLKMFLEWFDIEFHSLIFDLDPNPLERYYYGPDSELVPGSNGN